MDTIKSLFEALKSDINKLVGETITLGDNPITTLNIILWSLYLGFVIGIVITVYNRIILGGMIRRLVDRKAHTEGGALTLDEIGGPKQLLKLSLRDNSTFRRIVYKVGDTEEKRSKTSFESARFYIPEENLHRAESIYGNSGTSLMSILLSIVAFLAVVFLSFFIIPDLIQMLSNFIASIAPKSNIL